MMTSCGYFPASVCGEEDWHLHDNSCYKVVTGAPTTFDEAAEVCVVGQEAFMTSIHNSAENEFVLSLLDNA